MRLKPELTDLSSHLKAEDLFDMEEPTTKYGTEPRAHLGVYRLDSKACEERSCWCQTPDLVNSPPHYTNIPGVEAIQVTEHFNFNVGNAIKYLLRHEHKGNPEQDLEKALWYVRRELHRRKMLKAMQAKP